MSKEIISDMKDKNVLIVGTGKSGKAAAQAMVKLGAHVSIQDNKPEDEVDSQLEAYLEDKNIDCYWACQPEDMTQFDLLILSPGVPPGLPFIEEAKAAGAEIIGELEIAYRVGHGRYVAITGTNGKTTTTTLVGEIFKAAARQTCRRKYWCCCDLQSIVSGKRQLAHYGNQQLSAGNHSGFSPGNFCYPESDTGSSGSS